MPSERKWAFCVRHVLEAIEKIDRYTVGLPEEGFKANSLVRDR